jgi:hypothetical protein
MNGQVRALLAVGSDLIAGGDFTTAGGNPAKFIAKWDGSQWTEFGGGMDAWVRSLALINGEIVAGGSFTKAGADSINRFAKWTGSHWEKFGRGMTPSQWGNPIVQSIVPMGDEIYCGGTFEVAGGKPSSFIAHWLRWPVGTEEPVNLCKSNLKLKIQPNPFSRTAVISWQSAVGSQQFTTHNQVLIKVFDFTGKEVSNPVDAIMAPGEHQVTFDASGLPAGMYTCQLQVDGRTESKKMVIIK